MANTPLSSFNVDTVTNNDTFAGVRDDGVNPKQNLRFRATDIPALTKKKITVSVGGSTLTDSFFSNTISEIITNNIPYISGVDFSQAGTTITWINGNTFASGQVILAKI